MESSARLLWALWADGLLRYHQFLKICNLKIHANQNVANFYSLSFVNYLGTIWRKLAEVCQQNGNI